MSECCELQVGRPSRDRAQVASVGNLCPTRSLGAWKLEINQTRPLPLRVSFILLWAVLINCTLDSSVVSVQSESRRDERSGQQEPAETGTPGAAGVAECESGCRQCASGTLRMFLPLLGISEMGSSISIH